MRYISLTASELSKWLAERGVELKESFWHVLHVGCKEHVGFEHDFVIDQTPWPGALRISVYFVGYPKIREAGWRISEEAASFHVLADEIFVMSIVVETITLYHRRLKRPSRWLTPHSNYPEYGLRIDYPTLDDLNMVWQRLSLITPRLYSLTETVISEIECATRNVYTDQL